jgi:hypothetical protein
MNNKFKKSAWISFGIIFVSIVIASGVFYYFSADLKLQADKVTRDRGILSDQNSALSNFAELKKDSTQAEVYAAAMNRLLPDQNGLVGFGGWLDQIAKKYQVTDTFSFEGGTNPAAGANPGTVNFSLESEGTISNIGQFVKDIESQSTGYLFSLNTFDLDNNNGAAKLTAQGTLFFQ